MADDPVSSLDNAFLTENQSQTDIHNSSPRFGDHLGDSIAREDSPLFYLSAENAAGQMSDLHTVDGVAGSPVVGLVLQYNNRDHKDDIASEGRENEKHEQDEEEDRPVVSINISPHNNIEDEGMDHPGIDTVDCLPFHKVKYDTVPQTVYAMAELPSNDDAELSTEELKGLEQQFQDVNGEVDYCTIELDPYYENLERSSGYDDCYQKDNVPATQITPDLLDSQDIIDISLEPLNSQEEYLPRYSLEDQAVDSEVMVSMQDYHTPTTNLDEEAVATTQVIDDIVNDEGNMLSIIATKDQSSEKDFSILEDISRDEIERKYGYDAKEDDNDTIWNLTRHLQNKADGSGLSTPTPTSKTRRDKGRKSSLYDFRTRQTSFPSRRSETGLRTQKSRATHIPTSRQPIDENTHSNVSCDFLSDKALDSETTEQRLDDDDISFSQGTYQRTLRNSNTKYSRFSEHLRFLFAKWIGNLQFLVFIILLGWAYRSFLSDMLESYSGLLRGNGFVRTHIHQKPSVVQNVYKEVYMTEDKDVSIIFSKNSTQSMIDAKIMAHLRKIQEKQDRHRIEIQGQFDQSALTLDRLAQQLNKLQSAYLGIIQAKKLEAQIFHLEQNVDIISQELAKHKHYRFKPITTTIRTPYVISTRTKVLRQMTSTIYVVPEGYAKVGDSEDKSMLRTKAAPAIPHHVSGFNSGQPMYPHGGKISSKQRAAELAKIHRERTKLLDEINYQADHKVKELFQSRYDNVDNVSLGRIEKIIGENARLQSKISSDILDKLNVCLRKNEMMNIRSPFMHKSIEDANRGLGWFSRLTQKDEQRAQEDDITNFVAMSLCPESRAVQNSGLAMAEPYSSCLQNRTSIKTMQYPESVGQVQVTLLILLGFSLMYMADRMSRSQIPGGIHFPHFPLIAFRRRWLRARAVSKTSIPETDTKTSRWTPISIFRTIKISLSNFVKSVWRVLCAIITIPFVRTLRVVKAFLAFINRTFRAVSHWLGAGTLKLGRLFNTSKSHEALSVQTASGTETPLREIVGRNVPTGLIHDNTTIAQSKVPSSWTNEFPFMPETSQGSTIIASRDIDSPWPDGSSGRTSGTTTRRGSNASSMTERTSSGSITPTRPSFKFTNPTIFPSSISTPRATERTPRHSRPSSVASLYERAIRSDSDIKTPTIAANVRLPDSPWLEQNEDYLRARTGSPKAFHNKQPCCEDIEDEYDIYINKRYKPWREGDRFFCPSP